MRSRVFRLLASLFAAVLLLSSTTVAFAQEEAASLDLGDLNLKVTNTEVVNEVTNEQGGRLVAEDGQKLVVVTLQGDAAQAGEIVTHPEAFTAHDGETFVSSGAVALRDDEWVFPSTDENEGTTPDDNQGTEDDDARNTDEATLTVDQPGQVTFKVAFVVDEGVTTFDVHVPSIAEGTATVDESGTTPEDGTTPNQ